MKLKYTKFKQRYILTCSGLKKEGVNRKELDVLYDPPEGLLRVIDYDEAKRIITYDVGCCVPLQLYYKQRCFTEDEVLMLVRQLLSILGNLERSRLTAQKLILEFKNVFYNIDQRMLQIVFCPVQNNYSPLESEQIFTFLRELVTNAVVIRDGQLNVDKIQSFLYFLKKQQQFSAQAIEVFFDDAFASPVSQEPQIEIPTPSITAFPTASSPSNAQSGQAIKPYVPGYTSNSPEAASRIAQQAIKSPIPIVPIPSSAPISVPKQTNTVLPPIITPGDTVDAFDEIGKGGIAMPGDTLDASETAVLRHDASGIEYELPYGDCIIGRVGVDGNGNPVSPDLIVTDNKKVGKHHAKITYDGLHYYIIDLASKNKTWVNGQLLESGYDPFTQSYNGRKAMIENGTKIQLACEGYTFIIRNG